MHMDTLSIFSHSPANSRSCAINGSFEAFVHFYNVCFLRYHFLFCRYFSASGGVLSADHHCQKHSATAQTSWAIYSAWKNWEYFCGESVSWSPHNKLYIDEMRSEAGSSEAMLRSPIIHVDSVDRGTQLRRKQPWSQNFERIRFVIWWHSMIRSIFVH